MVTMVVASTLHVTAQPARSDSTMRSLRTGLMGPSTATIAASMVVSTDTQSCNASLTMPTSSQRFGPMQVEDDALHARLIDDARKQTCWTVGKEAKLWCIARWMERPNDAERVELVFRAMNHELVRTLANVFRVTEVDAADYVAATWEAMWIAPTKFILDTRTGEELSVDRLFAKIVSGPTRRFLSRERARRRRGDLESLIQAGDAAVENSTERIIADLWVEVVEDLLVRMTPHYREIMYLYLEFRRGMRGQTPEWDRIAETLGLSVQQAQDRFKAARKQAQRILRDAGYDQ
jgi:hypothetical protein